MRIDSAKYTEAHFDAKASRYQAALRSSPGARHLELLPFPLFLGEMLKRVPATMTLADLLCGSGFVTSALKDDFKRVWGVDVSQGMLSFYPGGPGLQRIKSSLDEQSSILTRIHPDVIVALAGLHHVYEVVEGSVSPDRSDLLQQALVIDWVETLPRDGAMIIADITDPECPPVFTSEGRDLNIANSRMVKRYMELSSVLSPYFNLSNSHTSNLPNSIGEYVSLLLRQAPCAAKAQPGLWFRNVVSKYGIYGHVDHFLKPSKIVSALQQKGFHTEYHELPTPWIFPSMDAFIYFFYEKFAFDSPVDSYDDIPAKIRRLITDKAQTYLGLDYLSTGAVAVGWRLGYYVVKRAD